MNDQLTLGNIGAGGFAAFAAKALSKIPGVQIQGVVDVDALKSLLGDQWAWIKDHSHRRVIDDTNAVESLRIAEEATMMAFPF